MYCAARTVFPVPVVPVRRTSDPRTKPPPRTSSSPGTPVFTRSAATSCTVEFIRAAVYKPSQGAISSLRVLETTSRRVSLWIPWGWLSRRSLISFYRSCAGLLLISPSSPLVFSRCLLLSLALERQEPRTAASLRRVLDSPVRPSPTTAKPLTGGSFLHPLPPMTSSA